MVDGKLIAAVEEERFRRIKHWAGLPTEAIRYCLEEAGIGLEQVDAIAINQDPKANLWRKIGFTLANRPDLIDENLKVIDEWFERQNRYSSKDAEYELLLEQLPIGFSGLYLGDPLRRRAVLKDIACRFPGRALLYFIYSYIFRRGFLDGWDGLVFCLMKSSYQRMVVIKKYDMRRRAKTK